MDSLAFTPKCPSCGKPMKLARVTPRFGGLPELRSFECRPCNVTLTEAVEDMSAQPSTQFRGV